MLAPELSDESDADDEDEAAKARFGVGSPVEVMRSDGLFTLATIVDYDAGGRSIESGPNAGVGADNPNKSPLVFPLGLSDDEKADTAPWTCAFCTGEARS